MRNLLASILVIAALSSCSGPSYPRRAFDGCNGKVSSIATYYYEVEEQSDEVTPNELAKVVVKEFDDNGNQVMESSFNHYGELTSKESREYDKDNIPTRLTIFYDDEGYFEEGETYIYKKNGKGKLEVTSERSVSTITYSKGKIISENDGGRRINTYRNNVFQTVSIEDEKLPVKQTEYYTYDEYNNLLKTEVKDEFNPLRSYSIEYTILEMDSQNNWIKRIGYYNSGEVSEYSIREILYR